MTAARLPHFLQLHSAVFGLDMDWAVFGCGLGMDLAVFGYGLGTAGYGLGTAGHLLGCTGICNAGAVTQTALVSGYPIHGFLQTFEKLQLYSINYIIFGNY